MNSYASIDRIEGNMAVCEVELVHMSRSRQSKFACKPTRMMDFPVSRFTSNIEEGDIFVVEHDGKGISRILFKDDVEKNRRKEIVAAIIGRK